MTFSVDIKDRDMLALIDGIVGNGEVKVDHPVQLKEAALTPEEKEHYQRISHMRLRNPKLVKSEETEYFKKLHKKLVDHQKEHGLEESDHIEQSVNWLNK